MNDENSMLNKNKYMWIGIVLSCLLIVYSIVVYIRTPKLYSKTFLMAGTFITVSSTQKEAIAISRAALSKYEAILNIYDEKSELSRINAEAFEKDFSLSSDMLEFLLLAKSAYTQTGGVFDISIGNLIKLWKSRINDNEMQFPTAEEIALAKKNGGFSNVLINDKDAIVKFTLNGLKLDPGGIAKGFLVDKAVEELRSKGINSAIINAGGDIYCLGDKFGKPWKVGLNDPLLGGVLDAYPIVDQAVATSGDYEQFFTHEDKRYSHIIDPLSGYPVANNIVSVTVIAHNLSSADVFATTFMVLGPEKTQEFLLRTNSNMKVFMIELIDGKKKMHIMGDIN